MQPITHIRSRTLVLAQPDIDTDQIIPARFLTTTGHTGLGQHAFADWRYRADGSPREDCPLNQVDLAEHRILIAGSNFGCGSSREHAAWALADLGIAAVLSTKIADIFRANALENGVLAATIPIELHRWLLDHPGEQLWIDVAERRISRAGADPVDFALEPFARYRLINGVGSMAFLRSHEADIARHEQAHR